MTVKRLLGRFLGDFRWIIVAVHVSMLAVPPIYVSVGLGSDPPTGPAVLAVPLGVAVLALQLRHSFALARGHRPRAVWVTVSLLVVLVYAPLPVFSGNWVAQQACVLASTPLVLRGRLLGVAIAASVLGTALSIVLIYAPQVPLITLLYYVVTVAGVTLVFPAAALWGSARLVGILDELRRTRSELADIDVGRERLRVSRDLHDLLGQSLSAISLKGELAARLLARDAQAAHAEVESLTGVARDALHGVRAITRDEHAVSLRTEIDGAAALAAAAHIAVSVDVDLKDLPPAVESMLAWSVREGVTNVLRHSEATTCSISAHTQNGVTTLTIANDGVRAVSGHGSGLGGLTHRAHALSGAVEAVPIGADRFRLVVRLPRDRE